MPPAVFRAIRGDAPTAFEDSTAPREFDAFISYSHAADGKLAPALQTALLSIGKPWYRRRALRLFRDTTTLSASPELWQTIERALMRSRYLILLTSPDAAASRWVDQEVASWRAHRDSSTCLIVLTGGELAWDERDHDFTERSSVPPSLRGWYPSEPFWLDLRWAHGEQHLSKRNPAFRDGVASLAAAIRGVDKDDLVGEDIRQHRRAVRLARAAVVLLSALVVGTSVAALVAVRASHRAEEQARIALSRQLAAQADVAQRDRRFDLALLLALEANRTAATPEGRDALIAGLLAAPHLRAVVATPAASEAAISGDRRRLAVLATSNRVRVWDLERHRPVGRALQLHEDPTSIALNHDGRVLAVGYAGVRVELWDVLNRTRIRELSAGGRIPISPYDRVVELTFGSGDALAWNLEFAVALWNGRRILRFLPEIAVGESPPQPAVSADGRFLAVGAFYADEVAYWRLDADGSARGPRRLLHLLGSRAGAVTLAFSPSGRSLLAVGGRDGTVTLWDLERGSRVGPILRAHGGDVQQLSFSHDGRVLAAVDAGGTAAWKIPSGARVGRPLSTYASSLGAFFVGRQRTLASVDGRGGTFLADLDIAPWPARVIPREPRDDFLDLALSDDGQLLAAHRPEGGVRLWDLNDRSSRLLHAPSGEDAAAAGVRFNARGDRLAIWGDQLQLVDTASGRPLRDRITVQPKDNRHVPPQLLAADFRAAAVIAAVKETTGSWTQRIRLWDISQRRYLSAPIPIADPGSTEQKPPILGPSLSGTDALFGPGLDYAALPVAGGVELREVASGRLVTRRTGTDFFHIAFDYDGSHAAVSTSFDPVEIIDLRTGSTVGVLGERDPDTSVVGLAFSGDGAVLATITQNVRSAGGPTFSLRLWDVERQRLAGGRSLVANATNRGGSTGLAFAKKTKRLVTYGLNDSLFLWDIGTDSWTRRACRILGPRRLTAEERRIYIGDSRARVSPCG